MGAFDLIIWDCDGCLVDSEVIASQAELDYLNSLGLELTLDDYIDKFAGRSMKDCLSLIDDLAGKPIAQSFDRVKSRQNIARNLEANLKPIDGLAWVLDALDIDMCIASGSELDRILQSLELVGVERHFVGKVFTSHQVERGKPAPDVFLFAAKQMGVQPARCLVIEDSLHGVKAAKAAGMTVFAYFGASHVSDRWRKGVLEAEPDLAFDDMRDLPRHVNERMMST